MKRGLYISGYGIFSCELCSLCVCEFRPQYLLLLCYFICECRGPVI